MKTKTEPTTSQRYALQTQTPHRNGDRGPANRRPNCAPPVPVQSSIQDHASDIQDPSSNTEHPASTIEDPNLQLATFNLQPPKRTRTGKIARLPYEQRDMVNRMLRNNISYDKICQALEEHNLTVTERNISNWKTRGGYHDWCIEQDRAIENHLVQDNLIEHLRKHDATDLPEIGLQLAATNLSQFFLHPETQKQLATAPEKFARTVSMICRLSRHLHALQKYRDDSAKELGYKHNPLRIKIDLANEVEITRNAYSSFIPENAPIDPEIPHRNFLPKNPYTPPDPLPE